MSVEKELADIMLGALTIDIREELKQSEVPLSEQIRTIKTNINSLPIDTRKQCACIVVNGGYKHLFGSAPEGIIINLDKLPTYIINDIYDQVVNSKS